MGKQRPQTHLFTNILVCKDCGKALWYVANRKGYMCGNYYKHCKIACSQHKVVEKELEEVILSDIKHLVKNIEYDDVLNKYKNKIKKNQKSIDTKFKKLETQKQVLEKKKSQSLDLLLENIITKNDYQYKINEINNNIQEIEEEK